MYLLHTDLNGLRCLLFFATRITVTVLSGHWPHGWWYSAVAFQSICFIIILQFTATVVKGMTRQ